MLTRCNRCGTNFEISAELVHSDDATVRCGECRTIFNARDCLVDEDLEYRQAYGVLDLAGANSDETKPSSPVSQSRTAESPRVQSSAAPTAVAASATVPRQPERVESPSFAEVDSSVLESSDTLLLERNALGSETAVAPAASSSVARRQTEPTEFLAHPDTPLAGNSDSQLQQRAGLPESVDIEFERTLALDGLTGIEQQYHSKLAVGQPAVVSDASSGNAAMEKPFIALTDVDVLVTDDEPQSSHAREQSVESASSRAQSAGLSGRKERLPEVVIDNDYPGLSDDLLDDRAMYKTPAAESYSDSEFDNYGVQQTRYKTAEEQFQVRPADAHPAVNSAPAKSTRVARRTKQSAKRSILPVLMVVPLFALALLFLLRDSIPEWPLPVSVLQPTCQILGCEMPLQSDLSSIQLLDRKIVSHPTAEKALYVSIDVVNKAKFAQAYPVLGVTLANSNGESVASRDFTPQDYLASGLVDTASLEPDKPVRINLEIVDPGVDAKSFEIEFR